MNFFFNVKMKLKILIVFLFSTLLANSQGRMNHQREVVHEVSNKEVVQSIYPTAAEVKKSNDYWYNIIDNQGKVLGYAMNSKTYCQDVIGYRKQTPVMIHRAIAGSLERFLSVIIEHFAGAFPLWLSPVQVVIIPVSDKFNDYGSQVKDRLIAVGYRTELFDQSDTLGKRIRLAQQQKIPYILVVGEKEVSDRTVSVRSRDNGDEGVMLLESLIQKLNEQLQ